MHLDMYRIFIFHYTISLIKTLSPLFLAIRNQDKPIVTRAHAFSRALRQLPVIASSFDWFTVLSVFFVIG